MRIEQVISKFCLSKGIKATKERIQIHAKYLKNSIYSEEDIVSAIGELFGETEFFPDASLVIKKLKPSNESRQIEAQRIVDKILEAGSMFSSYGQKSARSYLGETAWGVVVGFGGWDCITNLTYQEMTSARAQLRRVAEAAVYKSGGSHATIQFSQDKNKVTGSKLESLDLSDYIV